jgi:hypothetical protein
MAPLHMVLAGGLAAAMAFNVCEAFAPMHQAGLLSSRGLGRAGAWDLRPAQSCRARANKSPRSVAAAPRMDSQSKISASEQFWTRPRTTNANFGVFFEVVAKDRPIWITGIQAGGHSFANHDEYTRMKIRVLTADGSAVGKELDQSAWKLLGEVIRDVQVLRRPILTCSALIRLTTSTFPALKLARSPRFIPPCPSLRFRFRPTLPARSASTRTEKPASR